MSLAGALARKGAAVTFSQTTPGTYDGTTGLWSDDVTVTVSGTAMQIEGNPEQYAALGLIQSANPTLLFRPAVVGVLPSLGMTVVWGGAPLTVKDVEPLAMNGTATAARVRVSR
jgi:hypothetical protein